jgi:MFS family permease
MLPSESASTCTVTLGLSAVARRRGQLLLLTLSAAAGIYARTTMGPLQEAMRIALSLSDDQIALLQGVALALPFGIMAAPLGLAIDRYSRVRLLLIAVTVDLIGGVASALASDFTTIFAARCLVGFATPAIAIAAYSIVGDLFSPTQRGRAVMTIVLGQAAGSSAAFALGGELLAVLGEGSDSWHWAMLWMSAVLVPIVGLLLALREPPRTGRAIARASLRDIGPELWRYRAVIATLFAGFAVVNLADGAVLVWAAPALSRNFNLASDRVGAIMATSLLVGGVAGPIAGGVLADVCQRTGGPRRTVSTLCVLTFLSAPMGFFALVPTAFSASVPLTLFLTIGTAISVMTTATSIIAIPNELRGLVVSLKTAAAVLFGLGLAPLSVSMLSNALGGTAAIGKALGVICAMTSLLGSAAFVFGRRFFPDPKSQVPDR